MANSKVSAFFSLLLVFVSGCVVGAVGFRVYNTSTAVTARPQNGQPRMNPDDVKKQLIAETAKEVHLTDAQVVKLGQIYDGTREKFMELSRKRNADGRAIWDEQIKEIEDMLTPEQRPLYQQLRERRDKERQEMEKRRGHKGPGEIRKD